MAEKYIDIIIDEDGNAEIDVVGVVGPDCLKLTKLIEDSLGVVTDRKLKPEYAQLTTKATNKLKNKG